jgi:hypothetical protein
VFWKDPEGTSKTSRAMLEDISAGGARFLMMQSIEVGSPVELRWLRRDYSGSVRYCYPLGADYVLGFQKDPGQDNWPIATRRQAK